MPPFWKKNNGPLIPPVAPTEGQLRQSDPYAARAGGGAPAGQSARDQLFGGARNDPYAGAQANGSGGAGNPYAQANPYGAQGGEDDAARNELFGGMQQQARPAQRRQYGYEGREEEEDFDEDDEIEGIKQGMRETKQDSLASTRNALRLAREAEDTARGTIATLADQSESLANSERYLDVSKANSQRAEDKASELKQLNKSIFRPTIVWNKDAKRAAQERKLTERHDMERRDRQQALNDVQDTRRRLADASQAGGAGQMMQPGRLAARKQARGRYQFDATASDDELEDEVDDNLNEMLDVTKRLNGLATGMGTEVEKQNKRIGKITDKTDNLDIRIQLNTDRLNNIK